MAGLTSEEILAIVLVVVICTAMAAVGVLLLQRLRRRRDQLRGELSSRPEAVSDRAFNRIAMARREADILGRQGVELSRVRELIGEAQAEFDGRQFEHAYSLAQSAHELLVAARQRPPSVATGPSSPPPAVPAGSEPRSPATPAAKIPAHRAEAQFQLRLLQDEVARPAASGAGDGRRLQAQALAAQAQQAFDRGDYAESFRLALKGRREGGLPIETVAPPGHPSGVRASADAAGPTDAADDPERTADSLASLARCPHCGHPMGPSEQFCRGCGAPRAP